MKASLHNTPVSFAEYLARLAAHNHRTALVTADGQQHYTYSQLVRLIYHNASVFASQIKPGDRVLLSGLEGPSWVVGFFAVILLGGVAVPIDSRLSTAAIRKVCCLTGISCIIASAATDILDVPHLQPSLVTTTSAVVTAYPAAADHPAEILLTSGTWGEPKGVLLTHRNLLSNLGQVLHVYQPKSSECGLSILPLSHAYEQMGGLLIPLLAGCQLVYQQKLDRRSLIQSMKQYRPTTMVVVPRLLEVFYQSIIQNAVSTNQQDHLKSMLQFAQKTPTAVKRKVFYPIHRQFGGRLRTFIVGGAPLAPQIDSFFQDLGFQVITGYGLTEASPAVTMRLGTQQVVGSVGKLLPGIEAHIEHDGELLLRGSNISTHYLAQPSSGEWLRTGDLAKIDLDGNLFITGRKKNLVVYPTGDKIQLEDIELLAEQHPAVAECATVCLYHGAKPVICLLFRGEDITCEDLVQFVKSQLPQFARIDRVIKVANNLPRSHTLKLNRAEIQFYAEQTLTQQPDSNSHIQCEMP